MALSQIIGDGGDFSIATAAFFASIRYLGLADNQSARQERRHF